MCGIVGMLDPRRSRTGEESAAILERLAITMANRGPDDSGTWTDENVGIGFSHRRLAVVDLSEHGAQPMHSADGRYVINYNGEIYNHAVLSEYLRRAGVRLSGHSDTEVLVEAIAHWGLAKTLDLVDGMFAFAVWDRVERHLVLARDRIGEKPLYYGTLGSGEFVFASTLDVIRLHPSFDRPIDVDALSLFFRHSYIPAPWTAFRGISKLVPGTTVTVSASGKVGDPVPYWSLHEVAERGGSFPGNEHDAVEELDQLLRRSVGRRMTADVPVGVFLSGGVDSSTIAGVAQSLSSEQVSTFTIGSTEGDFDESGAAAAIAKHLGTRHAELIVSDRDALAAVESISGIHDEPYGDSSQIPTYLLAQMAGRSVTVALSGDGGDELFGGYNRYVWATSIWSNISRAPRPARKVGTKALQAMPQGCWDRFARVLPESRRPQQLGLKISKVLDVLDARSGPELFHRLTSDWLAPEGLVRGATEPTTIFTDPSRWPKASNLVEHMMLIDALTFLPDDVLTKVDRATMAVSLEARVPFLDRDIVEFATSLPSPLKLRNGVSKWPLRQVLHRYVPETLVDRPKAGFGVPIDKWLRGPLQGWADELLHSPVVRAMLDERLVAKVWKSHLSGRRNNAYLLWDVLMFADWCNQRGLTDFSGALNEPPALQPLTTG